jgi:hypothetical protein
MSCPCKGAAAWPRLGRCALAPELPCEGVAGGGPSAKMRCCSPPVTTEPSRIATVGSFVEPLRGEGRSWILC